MDVPAAWQDLDIGSMSGVVLIVGTADTGKTTLARYLYERLRSHHGSVAVVDGDMGQATLGPPTTLTAILGSTPDDGFPPSGTSFRAFVGDISPTGQMLPTVVGAHRIVQEARRAGASNIVYDTTGLVDPSQGGGALKRALVDLLRPSVVIALQRESELEHLLVPLRRSARTQVVDRPVPGPVRYRGQEERRRHRARQYAQCFGAAGTVEVQWPRWPVFPAPSFNAHRVVAFEDQRGLVLGLGIVIAADRDRESVEMYTSITSMDGVDAIHVGDVAVDPNTFEDRRI